MVFFSPLLILQVYLHMEKCKVNRVAHFKDMWYDNVCVHVPY